MFSNLLVGVLASQVQEVKRSEQMGGERLVDVPDNGDRISDKEMLQRICICGCVDEEDAANCDCSCHRGIPCDDENCVVCKAEKALQLAKETFGRRTAPRSKASKKPTKKKTVKKASRKKSEKMIEE